REISMCTKPRDMSATLPRADALSARLTGSRSSHDGLGAHRHSRRDFLGALGSAGILAISSGISCADPSAKNSKAQAAQPQQFRVWVFSDAHVGRDLQYGNGRESLADALRQSESASGFDWDIALDLGDISGELDVPGDPEGAEIVRQFGVLKKHRREQI